MELDSFAVSRQPRNWMLMKARKIDTSDERLFNDLWLFPGKALGHKTILTNVESVS